MSEPQSDQQADVVQNTQQAVSTVPHHWKYVDLTLGTGVSERRPDITDCLICLEDLASGATVMHTQCGVAFHKSCIDRFLLSGMQNEHTFLKDFSCVYCRVKPALVPRGSQAEFNTDVALARHAELPGPPGFGVVATSAGISAQPFVLCVEVEHRSRHRPNLLSVFTELQWLHPIVWDILNMPEIGIAACMDVFGAVDDYVMLSRLANAGIISDDLTRLCAVAITGACGEVLEYMVESAETDVPWPDRVGTIESRRRTLRAARHAVRGTVFEQYGYPEVQLTMREYVREAMRDYAENEEPPTPQ